jgi:hypothetical protein
MTSKPPDRLRKCTHLLEPAGSVVPTRTRQGRHHVMESSTALIDRNQAGDDSIEGEPPVEPV